MAYFPNGTAGMAYQEDYCLKCRNHRDLDDGRGPGCAIWDAHLLFSYEAAGDKPEAKAMRKVLNVLIPEDDKSFPEQCAMYFDDGKDHLTLPMFPEATA